tara:strand:+ start:1841 stop:2212 length:372 start_codon:yes stop_codon:yes gene_type:complete
MVKTKQLTYNECIADGWEMTADGFWFKETSEQSGTRSVEYAPDNEYIDNELIEALMQPVETQTDSVQYAWSQEICSNDSELDTNEYEKLIELVFNEIKREYKDDETCRTNSLLLGKLLVLANQ